MVVSFDIRMVLTVITTVIAIVHLALSSTWDKKTWNKIARLITSSSMVMLLVALLTMVAAKGDSIGVTLSIASIILWFGIALHAAFVVGREN